MEEESLSWTQNTSTTETLEHVNCRRSAGEAQARTRAQANGNREASQSCALRDHAQAASSLRGGSRVPCRCMSRARWPAGLDASNGGRRDIH